MDRLGTDVSSYTDGCHTVLPPRKSLRQVATQGLGQSDVRDITFQGLVCYNSDRFMSQGDSGGSPPSNHGNVGSQSDVTSVILDSTSPAVPVESSNGPVIASTWTLLVFCHITLVYF